MSQIRNSVKNLPFEKYKTAVFLFLLTCGALLVHGYHPYAEDAEIYLPGVERLLDHRLFPVGQEFFQSHARTTLFPNLLAGFLRITHLPLEAGLFLWHVASIFFLLLACWQLASLLFPAERARWGAVCLIAALLTIPVSGTALYVMDQYLNPRNLAVFAGVFSVSCALKRQYGWALFWTVCAASVHRLMWVFPFSFCVLWLVVERFEARFRYDLARKAVAASAGLGLWIPFATDGSAQYHEAARLHACHYIQNWEWYEWLGLLAPLVLFWWFERIARTRQWLLLARVCRAFLMYGLVYIGVALVLDLPPRFERLARVQPLRSLQLEYIFLFLCVGGLLAEYVLKGRTWRWIAVFLPLCVGMFAAQRMLFPLSAHVEWPGRAPKNPWARAFVWIKENTPTDAVFALDPGFMHIAGEDEIGFRCLAQRSRLADAIKDNGVVSMFPELSQEWWAQVQAQTPWRSFRSEDYARLNRTYGVGWVVLQVPTVAKIDCPYNNETIAVCRLQ